MTERDFIRFCNGVKDDCLLASNCKQCKNYDLIMNTCLVNIADKKFNVKKLIELVEKWNKENPVKTYRSDFFEKFPKVEKECFAHRFCRNKVYGKGECRYENAAIKYCDTCWDEEMPDEEVEK